jgi:biotin carboxyl carrier protein
LAAANPLAQVDEKSNVPPQVQMQLAQSQQVIQQLQQQLQGMQMDMKYGASIKQQQEEAETARKRMEVDARMAGTQMQVEAKANDTIIDSETRLEIERMKAQLALILSKIDERSERSVDSEAIERAI